MAEPTAKIETFEEFWDLYVGEHRSASTRILHFIGTSAAIGCLAGGLLTKRRWLLLVAPLVGYGPAWVSHFFVEKNKPLSFTYPLWSLRADFLVWWKTLSRQMQAEVDRVIQQEVEASRASVENESVAASPSAVVN